MTHAPLTALRALAGFALAAVVTAAAVPAVAQTPQAAPLGREDVERIIRETLVKNPEILQEAMQELERRATAEEDRRRKQALAGNRDLLVNSPRGIVLGNPQGDVTLVEFFDYNCGFCKRALVDLAELIKTDGKLRVVLKDFPVLGESSVAAAKVAVAAKLQASGAKYFEFHQKLMLGRGEATRDRALAVAKEVGLDVVRLTKDLDGPEVTATLQENFRLAQELGLSGTPSYVVGEQVVVGAVGIARLQDQIKTTRAGCTTTSC